MKKIAATLPALLDEGELLARQIMMKDGRVTNFILCRKRSGRTFVVSLINMPDSASERQVVMMSVGQMMRNRNVVSYAAVSDCWLSLHDPSEGPPRFNRPSLDPERKKVVLIEAYNTIDADSRIFEINRSGSRSALVLMKGPGGVALGESYADLLVDPGMVQ